MNTFESLGINKISRRFDGKKIPISDLVDKPIEILDFELVNSKKKPGTQYARMQVRLNGEKFYQNTGSKYLVQILQQVNIDDLPIQAMIRGKQGYFYFEGTME